MTTTIPRPARADEWPARLPDPDTGLAGGRIRLVRREGRQQGAVRLSWHPVASSPFWSVRGRLSILVKAILTAPDGGGRSVIDNLGSLGVTAGVYEADTMCHLDLSGGHDELARCAPVVLGAFARRHVTAAVLAAAERRFVQERRGYLLQAQGAVDAERWRTSVAAPERFARDHVADGTDPYGAIGEGADWSAIGGIAIVGLRSLATAWAAAIGDDTGTSGGDRPDITVIRPPDLVTLPARRQSQSLISYGAITPLDGDTAQFDLELAIEVLGGWSGSTLNQLFRHELAWSYGVRAEVRSACVGLSTLLSWSIFLQTAPEHAAAVVDRIRDRARLLLAAYPSDAEVVRAARRILRRELLWEDSVAGVMHCHGGNVQSGRPGLAGRRWHHFTNAGTAELIRGVEHMLGTGTFIIVGAPDADRDERR
jgi:hypothetical protein